MRALVSAPVVKRIQKIPSISGVSVPLASALAPTRRAIAKLVPDLLAWFAANARKMPWRGTRDPYAIWISEIMLQQTQVKTVVPYWERWMRELPNVRTLAAAPPAKVLKLWEGLGYYTRARNLQRAAQLVVEKFGGSFPREFADILELPGIGRYTAGAICSIAYNQPTPILDGNVMRVLTRVFGIDGDPRGKATNQQLWELASALVAEAARAERAAPAERRSPDRRVGDTDSRRTGVRRSASSQEAAALPSPHVATAQGHACSHLNQSLMELGATLCTPRQPQCAACPARKLCVAHRDQRTHELPALAPRVEATARRFVAFVITRGNRHLVQQRPAGAVNAGLWEFPTLELTAGETRPAMVQLNAHRTIRPTARLGSLKHSITRYRITLEIFRAELVEDSSQPHEHWATAAELEELAFTSAHRKIVGRLA